MSAQLNQHLGKKLRLRRTSLGLTQTQVAKAINVTFQQIQKYEKGTNGVSSARLLAGSAHFGTRFPGMMEGYASMIRARFRTSTVMGSASCSMVLA